MRTRLPLIFFLASTLFAAQLSAKTLTVCPSDVVTKCEFSGNAGVQAAIDKAADGDVVLLRSGVYATDRFRDVPYKKYSIRGATVIQRKRIVLQGEAGVVIDGSKGPPVSAIVVNGGTVTIKNLTLRNLRAGDPEDDLYEGHGIFVIDALVSLQDVTIEKYAKMALTGRGNTSLFASKLRIQDGHVAIWLEESAHLRLCNAIVRNNDSAALAAYGQSSANVYNSVFDGNQDDGLYGENDAQLFITNSLVLKNRPFAIRVIDSARVHARYSVLFANEAATSSPEGKQQVLLGEGVLQVDPAVNEQYEFTKVREGDPDVRTPALFKSQIGLGEVAACQAAF